MNFTSLQYFLLAAETLNLTKTAEKLYISQQALSDHIKKLENELGVELFNRKRRLTLTYAGIRMAHYASEITRLEQQMRTEMRNLQAEEKGNIRVAINETRAADLMPAVLMEFCEEYPYVEISILEGDTIRVDNSLLGNDADIAVGLQPRLQNVQREIICTERLVLIIPKKFMSGLFGQQTQQACQNLTERMDIQLFTGMPFIMLNGFMPIRQWVDEYLDSNNVSINALFEVTGLQTLFSLVMNNAGIAFCTETILYSFRSDLESPDCSVYVFPIDTSYLDPRELGIFRRQNKQLSYSAQRFADLIKRYYHTRQVDYQNGVVKFLHNEMSEST